MREFIETWRLWRILVIGLGLIAAVWGLIAVDDTNQRIAIVALLLPFVFGVLAVRRPEPVEDSAIVQALIVWWNRRSTWFRRGTVLLFTLMFLSVAGFLFYSVKRGPMVPVGLSPATGIAAEGLPIYLRTNAPSFGKGYLYVRVELSPVGKAGLCVSPATIEYVPILDGQTRASASDTVGNNERAALRVDGPFDQTDVAMTVHTTRGCVVNYSIQEGYYRD